MRSLLKPRKAQFYILSAVAIVGILYFLSRWMEPSNIIDTSSVAAIEEPFVFNNLKEKAVKTVETSKSCEELKFNLGEYKSFVENYAIKEGWLLSLQYQFVQSCSDSPPTPGNVEFTLNLTTPQARIGDTFNAVWPG